MNTRRIALVFHDLCTNAAKYGALTRDTGSVELTWTMDKTNVVFGWKERGGPIVSGPPLSTGFGSQLVRATVEQSLSGTLNYDWGLEGAVVTFEISLSNLNA